MDSFKIHFGLPFLESLNIVDQFLFSVTDGSRKRKRKKDWRNFTPPGNLLQDIWSCTLENAVCGAKYNQEWCFGFVVFGVILFFVFVFCFCLFYSFFWRLENDVTCGLNLYLIFSLSGSCWNHFDIKMQVLHFAQRATCALDTPWGPPVEETVPSWPAREAKERLPPNFAQHKDTHLEENSEAPHGTHTSK